MKIRVQMEYDVGDKSFQMVAVTDQGRKPTRDEIRAAIARAEELLLCQAVEDRYGLQPKGAPGKPDIRVVPATGLPKGRRGH